LVNLSDTTRGVIDNTPGVRAGTSTTCAANTTRNECLWEYVPASSGTSTIRHLQSGNGIKLYGDYTDVLTVGVCQPWDNTGCQLAIQPDKRLLSPKTQSYGISKRSDGLLATDINCVEGTQRPECLWEFRT
jgi:hypothetical protein